MELTSREWAVEAGQVIGMQSSHVDGLPDGAASLDSVVVMRDIPFFWDTLRILSTDKEVSS